MPYRYEKIKNWDEHQNKCRISYVCKYEGCNKDFNKTWNLLDHVRMHEGIKPFVCDIWAKSFTQKGNLKKHNIVQHSSDSLEQRKKYKWDHWDKSYTERYNLIVSWDIWFWVLWFISYFDKFYVLIKDRNKWMKFFSL